MQSADQSTQPQQSHSRRSLETLSKQELITYQELFSIFDKDDEGLMPTSDLHLFIRGLGHCPTEEELKSLIENLDPNDDGTVSFTAVVEMLINRKKELNIEEELLESFEAIQNETGGHSADNEKSYKTSVTGAKKYLSEFGEGLTEAELEQFQEFLEENNLKEGIEFNFRDLTRILAYGYMN